MRKYCDSLTAYARAATRPVAVGSVVIGGGNPVRIQSMTNTDTNDTEASAAQVRRIAGAGAVGGRYPFRAGGGPRGG